MPTGESATRKRRGAWYTPHDLVELVVANTLRGWDFESLATAARPASGPSERSARERTATGSLRGRGTLQCVRVLDPACGDGRFLVAAGRALDELGVSAELVGVEVDAASAAAAERAVSSALPSHDVEIVHGDALELPWDGVSFHAVVGNPPFLSQLASETARGTRSRLGGGPYADVAVEFLTLAVDLVTSGGRVGLILPQSVLASRDAAPVRTDVDVRCERIWSWWSPRRHFDAEVIVCALGFERRHGNRVAPRHDPQTMTSTPVSALSDIADRIATVGAPNGHARPAARRTALGRWTDVVTSALGVPALPELRTDGALDDRAVASANFRDEYYGLVPAVADGGSGAPLVTSGLIDPGRCHWGRHPARFARRRFDAPTIRLDELDERMRGWAASRLVPKVLVASQTQVVEAVADPSGRWLPCVPITTIVPQASDAREASAAVWEIAAVLTSPVATVCAWHRCAGTGLSASSMRLGPRVVSPLPWPAGDLGPAVEALEAGDVAGCGRAVDEAYGVTDETIWRWWVESLPMRD